MKKHKKIISLFLSSALAFICTGNTAGAAVNLSTEMVQMNYMYCQKL